MVDEYYNPFNWIPYCNNCIFVKERRESNRFKECEKVYLAAGAFGGFIICAETMAIYSLGVTLTAGTLMVAQLLTATVIEMKGLFHIKKIQMERYHIVGTIVMIIGIVVFNM